MFACLYLPPQGKDPRAEGREQRAEGPQKALVQLARDFSPRVETHGDRTVTLDVSGLGSLLGDARAIGDQLRRTAADRGLRVHIAIAATATAARLLAHSRAGLTVIPPGEEAAALAPLPLSALEAVTPRTHAPTHPRTHVPVSGRRSPMDPPSRGTASARQAVRRSPIADGRSPIDDLSHWGLRTLGELAAIPANDLSERLGQRGILWQHWARGEDAQPLVPAGVEERFEESLDLEWPIDALEPLSFVVARLCDPLCERLEQRDRGAVGLHVTLMLVTKQTHQRSLQLPAPMRDARVLRTLALLDLESNPPPAAVDRVTIAVDVTEGRMLQFGLFARALPAERLATLLARLGALMGDNRIGAPSLVDTYRPGAFGMGKFDPSAEQRAKSREQRADRIPNPQSRIPVYVIRRFRLPIPARVTLEQGRPVRVVTDRRGFNGGKVERADGPWRSSGDWWAGTSTIGLAPWNCDEWDVVLSDGAAYRIAHAHTDGSWKVEGMLD